MKRIILAALVGGFLMFAWQAVAHMFTPLGHQGFSSLPHEEDVVGAMKDAKLGQGLYFFPGMDANASEQAKKEWETKHETGPAGLLLYQPVGGKAMQPRQLLNELATNLVAALLAAFILSAATNSALLRVVYSVFIGAIGWLSISASYQIWFKFPDDYILAQGIIQGVGWALSGVGMAICLRPAKGK